jgi:hypothetical protein
VTATPPDDAPVPRDPPSGPLIHRRGYEVEAYDEGDGRIKVRGRLTDVRPLGLFPGDRPLAIHDMVVDLVMDARTFTVVEVDPHMVVHPNLECTDVLPAYQQLVGLSIARGFTHRVRELFGGPRGCSHISALLQAMAPVAIQAWYSAFRGRDDSVPDEAAGTAVPDPTADPEGFAAFRMARMERNRNTCHVFADGGPMFGRVERGEEVPIPLWARRRLDEAGMDVADWHRLLA